MHLFISGTKTRRIRRLEERSKIESFRVETPLGALESDSGNHTVDVLSVGAVMILMYIFKRLYYK